MIQGVKVKELKKIKDERGWLSEVYRQDELDYSPAMSYISQTEPGVIRGPHEHVYQTDCFVFLGPGDFEVHLWDRRKESETFEEYSKIEAGESSPKMIVVPPGVVHGYKCVSSAGALSINLPDKLYKGAGKSEEIDEIRWEDDSESPYQIK